MDKAAKKSERSLPTATGVGANASGLRNAVFWAFGLLALVLLLLFHRSLQSSQVLFANDAPLGVTSAHSASMPGIFTGYWQDLNWIGIHQPSASPNLSGAFGWLLGPLFSARTYAPLGLLFFGMSVWLWFRAAGFHPTVCLLGGLAASLNSDAFSHGCWGLGSVPFSMGFACLAFAALVAPACGRRWSSAVLAGAAVGLSVMEGFDVGAILSLYVAAFVLFQGCMGEKRPALPTMVKGVARVALVALAAALVSAQALSTLIGTQVKGVSGMAQDDATRAQRWREATQWSLPRVETLQLVVPGLFGYRMDTPDGGNYWGGVGRDPVWDEYLASAHPDPARAPAGALLRHSGAGFYSGILVVLVGVFGLVNSWRKQGNPYSLEERRHIWFWAGAALISLLLAYGRHAPFYQVIYQLPFFSTIRNPIKFLHPLQIGLIILFGYGLQGLWRGYLEPSRSVRSSISEQLGEWWKVATTGDRRWVIGSVASVILAGFAWLLYTSSTGSMVTHLGRVGFNDPQLAREIARFSAGQAGVALLFLAASVGLVVLIMCGIWSGRRQRWAGMVVGLILVGDLTRANLPWIVYYDYSEKYASNAVIDFLRQDPWLHRVTGRLMPKGGGPLVNEQGQVFASLYQEWLEHHFQFYNIQALDVVQMPRTPLLDEAYMKAFQPANAQDFRRLGRLWELTNTRYVLGMTGFLDFLNQQFDVSEGRFRVHTAFTLVPKAGVEQVTRLSQLTVLPATNGPFAVFEFEKALPRASLVSQWEVLTNDVACLERLVSADFDPRRVVLVSEALPDLAEPPDQNSGGSVVVDHYAPKRLSLKASVAAPSVLLLNDRYHPDWKVYVNGESAGTAPVQPHHARGATRSWGTVGGIQVRAGGHRALPQPGSLGRVPCAAVPRLLERAARQPLPRDRRESPIVLPSTTRPMPSSWRTGMRVSTPNTRTPCARANPARASWTSDAARGR